MATLKELLGDKYKDGMSYAEVEAALADKNLADLSGGGYVSAEKYRADVKALNDYKAAADGKEAEIAAAVAKAKAEAEAAAKSEYEKKLESERTADKRKHAKSKHYEGLSDEQRGVFDAFLKEDDLKLAEDGESFTNFEDLAKPIREKYKTLFPVDDGSNGKAGIPPKKGEGAPSSFEYEDFRKLR